MLMKLPQTSGQQKSVEQRKTFKPSQLLLLNITSSNSQTHNKRSETNITKYLTCVEVDNQEDKNVYFKPVPRSPKL